MADGEAPGSGKKRNRSEAANVKELALSEPGSKKAPTDSLQGPFDLSIEE